MNQETLECDMVKTIILIKCKWRIIVIFSPPPAYGISTEISLQGDGPMHSKTKIVVLHMKELIYTGLFILLGVLFIILLVIMFSPKKDGSSKDSDSAYIPGVYTTSLILQGSAVDLEIIVNESEITSIRFVNLDDSVTTLYPLMEPALEDIADQIYKTQNLSEVKYDDDNRYTSLMLLEAISNALEKAALNLAPEAE